MKGLQSPGLHIQLKKIKLVRYWLFFFSVLLGTYPVFSDLAKSNIHGLEFSSASFFKPLGCKLCRSADSNCYLTFSRVTGMNSTALSSYGKTDFVCFFLQREIRFIYRIYRFLHTFLRWLQLCVVKTTNLSCYP